MDYQEQLKKINNAAESGDLSAIEDVKNTIESDRVEGENIGNSMVLMAADKALEKLSQTKKEAVEIPNWRMDQINRTGGTPAEIDRITAEINQQAEKSVIQGWYNIIKQIPESLRSAEQQREFEEYEKELGAISKSAEQTIRSVAAERVENERVAENLEKLDLNKISLVDAAMNETLGKYADTMSSQIASGASLWDLPSDDVDDEPVAFTQPIQPTAEKVDEAHKEYLNSEIDSIGSAISAGFGNEQALARGVELEKRLDEYNHPKVSAEVIPPAVEPVTASLEQADQNPKAMEGFDATIANLTRDDLGSLYGILTKQGNIDGATADQVWASIKLYMRGASDESHIPQGHGLRAKMMEIKKIRDAENAQLGISIDKESGAVTVDKAPATLKQEIVPEVVDETSAEESTNEVEPVSEQEIEEVPIESVNMQVTPDQKDPEDMFNTPPPIPAEFSVPEAETISSEVNHEPLEIKLVNSNERDIGFVPYQEYEKSFMYMDRGEGVDLSTIKDSPKLEGFEKSEMVFSYNPKTGDVMPRKDAWRQAISNSNYYLEKTFRYEFDILQTPFDQLVFKPAKLDAKGNVIQKGEIKIKGIKAMNIAA